MDRDAQTAYLEQIVGREEEQEPAPPPLPAEIRTGSRLQNRSAIPRECGPSFRETHGPSLYFALLALIPIVSVALWFLAPTDASLKEPTPDEWAALMNAPSDPAVSERSTPPLLQAVGELHVDSDPEGAFVYINGTLHGVTPYSADTLAPGWRTVTVERAGHTTRDTLLYIAPASLVSFAPSLPTRELEPPSVEPERALASATPANEPSLSESEPQREASAELDAASADPKGATEPQRPTTDPDPAPRSGTLSVLVRPWGSIFVDGTLRARDTDLRWTDTVPAGTRILRVVHPVLGVQQHSVEVQPDQTTSLVIDLF